jgi:hypothetical protein
MQGHEGGRLCARVFEARPRGDSCLRTCPPPPHLTHTSVYVSIRQHTSGDSWRCPPPPHLTHTSAYVSIRQHTSGDSWRCPPPPHTRPTRIRQHTSAYVRIRQHTSAYVSIRHLQESTSTAPDPISTDATSAHVSICQHTSAYVSIRHT